MVVTDLFSRVHLDLTPLSPSFQDEHLSRRELWEENLRLINTHNLEASMGFHTYQLGMNHLGDLVGQHQSSWFISVEELIHQ